ncbi:MT-A70 family methyltransferase [Photobacterium indicum]|uniref:DNA methyltransferase n=1 Tax=Photobacterium indicum TaxID=81447 RepID=A0A2T3L3C9_9GAMM|nr:MT-A70 family methyltransferase [Photobacterium indicum]PSV43612.1 hypothetical protein C9J47_22350 [Photobacterium indicum]
MKKYKLILASPPWKYSDKCANKGGIVKYYEPMSLTELSLLTVSAEIDPSGCALCLWTTFPQMEEAFKLIDAWGFEYVDTIFTWVKTYPATNDPSKPFIGMGHYTRSNAEIMFLAKPKGGRLPPIINGEISCVQYFPVMGGAKQPPQFRDLLVELFGDAPRVELFAKIPAVDWMQWGEEKDVDSNISVQAPQYGSMFESVVAHIDKGGPAKPANDFRAICPGCFDHGEISGETSGDAGNFSFNCKCGFKETGFSLSFMKSSINEAYKKLTGGENAVDYSTI